jgi:DNA-binding SARP family transcriptional activator
MGDVGSLGFNVLGPLRMTVDGKPLRLGTPKQKALLAMLIVNRNRPVSTDSLIDAAWEDRPPDKVSANLHAYIAELRKLINDVGFDGKRVLATVSPGYQLNVAEDRCDIGRFQAMRADGAQAAALGRFAQARRLLAAALDEWKGPCLDDLRDFQFAQVFAAGLDIDRKTTAAKWAEAEIACGRADAIVSKLDELTYEYPYEEPLWEQLITALYLTGRQAEALAACRRLRKILDEDEGIVPGPRIRDLQVRILRQDALDVEKAAKISAIDTVTLLSKSSRSIPSVTANLRDTSTGYSHALTSALTKIGREEDNDIVIPDVEVSRHHAAIVDTRASYLIVDTHSRNGVQVNGERIRSSATITDGSVVRIGGYEFAFEIQPQRAG